MEALELDEDYVPARLGIAEVALGRFEDRASTTIDEVMDAGGAHVEAHLMSARMSLELGALAPAREALHEALRIAESGDLPPLEAYSLLAAADVLAGITASEWTGRALDYNPSYGGIYATPAHFYLINRRYREAIELLFEAVRIQPDLWPAHTELGVNLLRQNRVEEARGHLALAYRGDPFSAQTVNTLRLIDSFENFQVLRRELPARETEAIPDSDADSDADSEGETIAAAPGMLLRLHNDEAPVLDAYVTGLVADSIRTFTERYRFDLQEDVVVELYPEHDDFAVRTLGLPGIGLLGVAFGYLVAMDSPSGSREGEFHWGTTLWHEIAHIFTLEATGNLVPRWFSEGVSVFEEWSTGPLPGRHIPGAGARGHGGRPVPSGRGTGRRLHAAHLRGPGHRLLYPGGVAVPVHRTRMGPAGAGGHVDGLRRRSEYRRGDSRGSGCRAGSPGQRLQGVPGCPIFRHAELADDWKELSRAAYEALDAGDWERVIEAPTPPSRPFPPTSTTATPTYPGPWLTANWDGAPRRWIRWKPIGNSAAIRRTPCGGWAPGCTRPGAARTPSPSTTT